jgi:hypothetical protein
VPDSADAGRAIPPLPGGQAQVTDPREDVEGARGSRQEIPGDGVQPGRDHVPQPSEHGDHPLDRRPRSYSTIRYGDDCPTVLQAKVALEHDAVIMSDEFL